MPSVDSLGYDVLPRGRHHLTREQVVASQRERLLQGVIDAVAEKGYARVSVADVIKRARVSRETFYEHFTDKQACFLAAYDMAAGLMMAVVAEAAGTDGAAMERFDRAVAGYLRALAADPARARTFLLEIYAAGPDAAVRRFEVQRAFVELVDGLLRDDGRWAALPDPAFATRMLVGGVASLVSAKIAAGEHTSLPALRAPIMAHADLLLNAAR